MENWNKPYSKRAYDKIQANVDKVNFNNDNTIIKVKVCSWRSGIIAVFVAIAIVIVAIAKEVADLPRTFL